MFAGKSRFRPMEIRQTRKFNPPFLSNYANAAAYRDDTRLRSSGEIVRDILSKCARTPTQQDWCGYWQGNKLRQESRPASRHQAGQFRHYRECWSTAVERRCRSEVVRWRVAFGLALPAADQGEGPITDQ